MILGVKNNHPNDAFNRVHDSRAGSSTDAGVESEPGVGHGESTMPVRNLLIAGLSLLLLSASGCTSGPEGDTEDAAGDASSSSDEDGVAPLLEGIGPVNFQISTDSARAQAYFNQALTFSYGFNHAEAARSFAEAARLDDTCGICWWGVALALGPNINKEMADEDIPKAWEALQNALTRQQHENGREQDYIDALSARYTTDGADRSALDAEYAEAMAELVADYPADMHALVLYAESLMDLYPWSYWDEDSRPKEHTDTLVAAIEQVMETDPTHPGALHLYIHVMEKHAPKMAEAAADRLGPLVPVAGHLVHMPSHIYLRVGRYHDAVIANHKASMADEDYIAQCNAQGFYPAAYYPHNIHFLWYSAMMEGRKRLAVESALKLVAKVPLQAAREFGSIQAYLAVPSYTYVRFGMWAEALAVPAPEDDLVIASYMRHYGRGMAHAALGDVENAHADLAAMQAITDNGEFSAQMDRQGDIGDTLASIATSLVTARIARSSGDSQAEIDSLNEAIASQDSLPYTEPPYWHFPIRQSLGSAHLRAGNYQQAADTFNADLDSFPDNGWSLHGLAEAYRGLGQATENLDEALKIAWQYSDIEPTAGAE
jgi:tetratricopeptide (TPR) repeat protein